MSMNAIQFQRGLSLAEFCYRFNRCFDLAAMLPMLLKALATTGPLPLKVLRLSEIGR